MGCLHVLHLSNTNIKRDNRIIKEINALSKNKNIKCHAIGISNLLRDKNAPKKSISTIKASIKIIKISSYDYIKIRIFKKLILILDINKRLLLNGLNIKAQIVHCHDIMSLPAALIIKLFMGSKLIYDAHELESHTSGQDKITSFLIKTFERFTWNYIDEFITVSESINEWYQRNFGPKNSTLILNSPEIKNNFEDSKSDNYFHKFFSIPNKDKIFIYVGELINGRGIGTLIDTFKKIEDKSKHIIFIGYGELEHYLKNESVKNNNIHLHEVISIDQLIKVIRSADVGICLIDSKSLSDYYSLPNKLFEYAFSGLKIISTNLPEIKKVIKEFQLGIICEANSSSLEKAIYKIESFKKSEKSNLYKISWEYQAEKLNYLYSNLQKLIVN
ncbi:glycosyltransferase [Prochlorococcus marinus]|uniref:Glycosyl transferase n=1 Tax=Prochlorococcus marinus str. GP2 TaxID=59925 RepID=A0A0A1ZD69_PROMR|nr:glycosyltransferase [Prochlorococcus marinus]KGF86481.1 glycosyl transferase [Prochlorococcus marinus str. GP2]